MMRAIFNGRLRGIHLGLGSRQVILVGAAFYTVVSALGIIQLGLFQSQVSIGIRNCLWIWLACEPI